MEIFITILILALHLFVIIDAFSKVSQRNGVFRLILAFVPPVIGPIIYLLTQTKGSKPERNRSFMKGKRRFS
ncbi:hypothetical protein [Ancylomarina sp. 16SWW S1-10-2]|uniref:hypothetical protein n=1 Tax=Ancylomarina sp. 16SWW S1-10-2 TaxID=2499681 RepID=UPI0012AE7290|nr:hypothetical protein [Ancylomarina sp. 16SWW S1-10-2]MRT92570.1 hypothetical protein [Ancylomarina sp. 16SWW S1-10-2]